MYETWPMNVLMLSCGRWVKYEDLVRAVGIFNDARVEIVDGIRYKTKNGKVAVLSEAAQRTFKGEAVNTYLQYSAVKLPSDDIGVYVEFK